MHKFLEINGVSRSYGVVPALANFSLTIPSSEISALVGPDGAGKTTLMRSVCNLIGLDSGEILIDGHNVATRFDFIKPILGYMPQMFSLYQDLSVEENLRFYGGIFDVTGSAFDKRSEELYRFSNLKPFKNRRAGALSGGMKQKLALSCALMHDPKILLLDEPTTGVDPLSRQQFWEILLELKSNGVTVFVSTPYMDEVARADYACFMFDGKKLTEGKPGDIPQSFNGQLYYVNQQPSSNLVKRLNSIKGIEARRYSAGMHLSLKKDDDIENYRTDLKAIEVDFEQITPVPPDLEDCFIQLMEKHI